MARTGSWHSIQALWNEAKQLDVSSPSALFDSLQLQWLLWKVRKYTMVQRPRLRTLYHLAREIDRIPISGDIVECGVYNGGSAGMLAFASRHSQPPRDLWLFDSFEGLPEASAMDGVRARDRRGTCAGDPHKVRQLMHTLGIAQARLHIIKGWFQDTFPTIQIERIALLHIDADWYESVRLCLQWFYDFVEPSGFVVLDDYGHWPGCRAAVDEFVAQRRLDVALIQVDYTGHYFQKPG